MGTLSAIWGFAGVFLLISSAAYRLSHRAIEALKMDLSTVQWIVLVVWVIFMVVAEGYRGFQKKFSPRTAARVRYIKDHPTPLRLILAPLFCMGYFFANRKTKIVAFSLTFGIILLVLLVSQLPQPWRGIVDTGVVLGLAWGLVSFAIFTVQALTAKECPFSPEVPVSS